MRASIFFFVSASWLAYSSRALGCTPMWLAMIISSRARPMPALGNWPKSNARSGLATFIMIFSGAGGMSARSVVVRSNGRSPA